MLRNSSVEMLLWMLRGMFISLECLILVIIFALAFACPSCVEIAARMPDNWEILATITAAAAILFGWQLKVVHEMRNPQCRNAQILHDWPGYVKLCMYCKVAIFYGVIAVALSASWMFSCVVTHGVSVIFTCGGLLLMCVSFLCCHNAKDDMEHILFGTGSEN